MTLKALTYLKISSTICNIGNYFWHLHVKEIRKGQNAIRRNT
jgi:hypothetical protein